jgi:hypothetical protein
MGIGRLQGNKRLRRVSDLGHLFTMALSMAMATASVRLVAAKQAQRAEEETNQNRGQSAAA